MKHPIINKKQAFLTFGILWLIIAILQFFLLNFVFQQQMLFSLSDTLVHLALFIPLALVIWYPVHFSVHRDMTKDSIAFNLIASLLFVSAVWLYASYGFLNLMHSNEIYLDFLSAAFYFRAGAGILLFAFIILIYLLMGYYEDYQEKIDEQNQLQASFREVQLSFLQSQINPHFLFNALNGINSLIITDQDKAQEMVVELSDFLRYSLEQGHNQFHELSEEIRNMERYLAIEKIRYGARLVYEINYSIETRKAMVPALILQPLLENAIKFSLHQNTEQAEIKCTFSLDESALTMTVRNTYNEEDQKLYGTGTGLKNITKRLEILFETSGLLQYTAKDGIFVVNVRIPQHIDAQKI